MKILPDDIISIVISFNPLLKHTLLGVSKAMYNSAKKDKIDYLDDDRKADDREYIETIYPKLSSKNIELMKIHQTEVTLFNRIIQIQNRNMNAFKIRKLTSIVLLMITSPVHVLAGIYMGKEGILICSFLHLAEEFGCELNTLFTVITSKLLTGESRYHVFSPNSWILQLYDAFKALFLKRQIVVLERRISMLQAQMPLQRYNTYLGYKSKYVSNSHHQQNEIEYLDDTENAIFYAERYSERIEEGIYISSQLLRLEVDGLHEMVEQATMLEEKAVSLPEHDEFLMECTEINIDDLDEIAQQSLYTLDVTDIDSSLFNGNSNFQIYGFPEGCDNPYRPSKNKSVKYLTNKGLFSRVGNTTRSGEIDQTSLNLTCISTAIGAMI